MGLPANRPKLWAGVYSGYVIAAAFALLALSAVLLDISPYGAEFGALLAVKLATNTVVLVALRRGGAEAGQVDRDHPRQRRQGGGLRLPHGAVEGKAVDQDQRRAGAGAVEGEVSAHAPTVARKSSK